MRPSLKIVLLVLLVCSRAEAFFLPSVGQPVRLTVQVDASTRRIAFAERPNEMRVVI